MAPGIKDVKRNEAVIPPPPKNARVGVGAGWLNIVLTLCGCNEKLEIGLCGKVPGVKAKKYLLKQNEIRW